VTSKQDRQDAADRAKYDGLVLAEVNALVRATRYKNGYTKPWFIKHREKFIREGYWDPTPKYDLGMLGGYPTARGMNVIRIAYGESFQVVEDAHRGIQEKAKLSYDEIKLAYEEAVHRGPVHSGMHVEAAALLVKFPPEVDSDIERDFGEPVYRRVLALRKWSQPNDQA
jgi:hypothetical protein